MACGTLPQRGLMCGAMSAPRMRTGETLGCQSGACELNHWATGPAPREGRLLLDFLTVTLHVRRKWNSIFRILKKKNVIFKYKRHRQAGMKMQEFRKYCSYEYFLRNLLENRLQTTKITRETLTQGMTVSIKRIVACG